MQLAIHVGSYTIVLDTISSKDSDTYFLMYKAFSSKVGGTKIKKVISTSIISLSEANTPQSRLKQSIKRSYT